ncbi:hypothetical protein MUK42_14373, partial [Musa troglodytarum]
IFCAPSQKFKILTIPNLFGLGKFYNLGYYKKRDDHKVCAKSMFDRFFLHHVKNSNIDHSQLIKHREVE